MDSVAPPVSYSSAAWSRDQTRALGREGGGEVAQPGLGRHSGSVGCGASRWKSSGAVAQPGALCCSPGSWLCSVSLAAAGGGEASVLSVPVSEPWPVVAASGRSVVRAVNGEALKASLLPL